MVPTVTLALVTVLSAKRKVPAGCDRQLRRGKAWKIGQEEAARQMEGAAEWMENVNKALSIALKALEEQNEPH